MFVLNLTQHDATPEQVAQGVYELLPEDKALLRQLLTFEEPPTASEMLHRARSICAIAERYMPDESLESYSAMIGGAPFFMSTLETTLFEECGICAKYSFSQRVSEEALGPNNEVVKTSRFKHIGFVDAFV